MKKFKETASVILVILCLLAAFAACGNAPVSQVSDTSAAAAVTAGQTSGGTSNSGNEKFTLTAMSYMTDKARMDIVQGVWDKVKAQFPNVTLEHNSVADYDKAYKMAFDSGAGPDVVYVDDIEQQTLSKNGYLMDITDMVNQKGWIEKELAGSIEMANARTPGKYFNVPFITAPVTVYYNKDIFAKVGITAAPQNMDEFNEDLAKIKAGGFVPIEGNLLHYAEFSLMFNNIPIEDIKKWYYLQQTTPAFESGFKDAIKQLDDWFKAGYFRKDMAGVQGKDVMMYYGKGQSALLIAGDWSLKDIEASGVSTGVFPFPRKDTGMPWYIVNAPDGGWAVNAKLDSKKKDAVAAFIDGFINPEVAVKYYEAGFSPCLKFDPSNVKTSPLQQELMKAISQTQIGYYLNNCAAGMVQPWHQIEQKLMLQQVTPDQFWTEFNGLYEKLKAEVK